MEGERSRMIKRMGERGRVEIILPSKEVKYFMGKMC